LAAAWIIARKDLAIEFRTRSAFMSAALLSLLAIVIFFFTWDATAVTPIDIAPGVMWVTFTFSGILGLHRSFGVEAQERAMDALLVAPVNLIFVVGVQLVAIPAVALFYNLPIGETWLALTGVMLLASVGLVCIGTLFAGITANTRMAELLLPVLALPFFVPIVLPAAQATAQLLAGRPLSDALSWLRILLAFDLVFLYACTLAFPFTLED
jgi:heme exporter protein B